MSGNWWSRWSASLTGAHGIACGDTSLSLGDLSGLPCYGGLDLATTTDLSSLVLVWPDVDGRVVCWPWFWVPAETVAARVQRDRVPYDVWVRQGHLSVTEATSPTTSTSGRPSGA